MIHKFQLILYTFKFNLKIFLMGKKKYVQFHNITFKMPESQLLIGLETSFKNRESIECQHVLYIKSVHLVLSPPPLAYGLYTCENVDIFGRPLSFQTTISHIFLALLVAETQASKGYEHFGTRYGQFVFNMFWNITIMHFKGHLDILHNINTSVTLQWKLRIIKCYAYYHMLAFTSFF